MSLHRHVEGVVTTLPHSFPPGFPAELAAEAFVRSEEAAWRPALALSVVVWLTTHGFAVLGTEVWRPEGSLIQSVPHFQSLKRQDNEDCNSFATRTAVQTSDYLKAFDGEFAKEGDVFINITWVSQSEFQNPKAT
jgi:hypothetical protein